MRSRRKPSKQFLRRLKSYSEFTEKKPSRIRRYKESDIWLWTEVAAVVIGLTFIIPTAIALWIDLEDRQTQRIAQAWESVTRVAPGNSGKGPALEYLNSQEIPLVGIDLSAESNGSPSYLIGVNLWEAVLRSADLSGANLAGAKLAGADLLNADLSGADLSDAYLLGADLSRADLTSADLSGAELYIGNLSGAKLSGTNLSGADLTMVDNLSQKMLDVACGNEKTHLPKGLTISLCPEK